MGSASSNATEPLKRFVLSARANCQLIGIYSCFERFVCQHKATYKCPHCDAIFSEYRVWSAIYANKLLETDIDAAYAEIIGADRCDEEPWAG